MASISGTHSTYSAVKIRRYPLANLHSRREPSFVTIPPVGRQVWPAHSVARDIPAGLCSVSNSSVSKTNAVEKDPLSLWHRYVDWLYQHKELGVYLDVSRIGFTNEFFERMEPMMQSAFMAMQELEKGAIANPDEGRMVGHYWLRNAALAPNSFLRSQIEKTLNAICDFAEKIINAKVRMHIQFLNSFLWECLKGYSWKI